MVLKVLHVIDSDGLYGAEVMLLNLMEEHKKMSLHPILLSIEGQVNRNGLRAEAKKRGIEAVGLQLSRGYSISKALKIIQCAKDKAVNLIHSHGYKGNILAGSLPRSTRKIPIVSTIHGWTATNKFSKIWFYSMLDRFFLRRMDAVFYVNGSMSRIGGRAKGFVVENGIPELKFDHASALESDSLVREFVSNSFIIGTICRLSEEKGLKHLIKAIRLLSDKHSDIKAIIIGEGPLEGQLRRIISDEALSDKILLAGYREAAFNYLPLFNIFALPSLTEGLPITLLEAMQAEVPIIATRVGGIPSLLEEGKLGLMVEPADAQALADAVEVLRSSPDVATTMVKKARQAALVKYSSRSMAEEYLKAYEDILK